MTDAAQETSDSPPSGWLLFFGIVFPLVALAFELLTELCRQWFYDPLPTPWYAALFAAIPVVNAWVFLRGEKAGEACRRAMLVANAGVGGIAFVFALYLLPLVPFSLIGSLFGGIGSLGLAPHFAFACAFKNHRWLVRSGGTRLPRRGLLVCGGAIAGILLTGLPAVRVQLTMLWLDRARSADPETHRAGIDWLRSYADEIALRDVCRGVRRSPSPFGFDRRGSEDWAGDRAVPRTSDAAIFYLVTGRALREAGESEFLDRGRPWFSLREERMPWIERSRRDGELALSRLDGVIEADGALGYLEWMLEIENPSVVQNLEAWADLQLPAGGFVSRLTLWVGGEEREAAFASKEKTTAAYESVVQTRRDPVLVTTRGPDRVRLRCFPVPARGSMKMRLGITFPLRVVEPERASFVLPSILATSFELPSRLRHLVWLSSEGELSGPEGASSTRGENAWELHAELPAESLRAPQAFHVARSAAVEDLWTEDRRSEQRLRARLSRRVEARPTGLVLLVEASTRTEPFLEELLAALDALPADLPLLCWVLTDELERPGAERGADLARARELLASRLRGAVVAGGVDHVPALLQVLRSTAATEAILWVHAPQPVEVSPLEHLEQHYDRRKVFPRLLEVAVEPGVDLVLRALDGQPGLESLPRAGSLREDLERAFRGFGAESSRYELVPEILPDGEAPPGSARRVSDHLARLWAHRRVQELADAGSKAEAQKLAQLYQLVTPLTGAVVLETQQQYAVNDLEPVDPSTVPSIPEPEEILLLVVAGLCLLWAWRRGGLGG
ncbi:MAG: hypothetical protein JNM84_05350 [Planctomycetes bacterium]|nr:hypothetical protein [Planctomycetota bacterium]